MLEPCRGAARVGCGSWRGADGVVVCASTLRLQEYIQRLLTERSEIEKKFHGMKDDLITRLQNACSQRDEARGQVRPWNT